MKNNLTKNLGMKILSLILATLLWLVVVNIDNPMVSETYRDIVVEIQNDAAIKSLDKVYEVVEGSTVDVTVRAKRTVLDTIKKADIIAVADLSNLSYTNAVQITVSCSKAVESLTLGKVSTLKVKLEDVDTKQLKITIIKKGTEEEGYLIGTIKSKPNIIQVTGAKSQIARIDQVRVEIDVSNASEDFTAEGDPKAYDAEGRNIDSNNLIFSSNKILLTATILKTKTIDLNIETKGSPLEGYRFVNIEYEPKKIMVAGEQSTLQNISAIPIKVDISNAYKNIEEEIDISNYLPEGIKIAEDSQTVVVNITIKKELEKTLKFNTNDIEIKNLPTGATFHFNKEDELSVKVIGLIQDLKNVTIGYLNPSIDLKNMEYGTHEVEILFHKEEGIAIQENVTLSIILSDGNESAISEEIDIETVTQDDTDVME